MTARGRGNLRSNPAAAVRRGNIIPGLKISRVFERNEGQHVGLQASYISDSLDRARHEEGFLQDAQRWLTTGKLKPLITAKESLFANTPDRAKADAISQGVLLGAAALRCAIDAGELDIEALYSNLLTWQLGKGVFYDQDADEASLQSVFSSEAAAALIKISTPVARTACAAAVLLALTPTPTIAHKRLGDGVIIET